MDKSKTYQTSGVEDKTYNEAELFSAFKFAFMEGVRYTPVGTELENYEQVIAAFWNNYQSRTNENGVASIARR